MKKKTLINTISGLGVMGGTSERGAGGPDPLKNHKNKGVLSNTGPDRMNNHKVTKSAFTVGSSLARQRNAI